MDKAFDKIETCACCGKDVKRPVRLRGRFYGKDCAAIISYARQEHMFTRSVMLVTKAVATYRPKAWEPVIMHAFG